MDMCLNSSGDGTSLFSSCLQTPNRPKQTRDDPQLRSLFCLGERADGDQRGPSSDKLILVVAVQVFGIQLGVQKLGNRVHSSDKVE